MTTVKTVAAALATLALSSGAASAGTCMDGLDAIGRTLPYLSLERQESKSAHTLLRRAYKAGETGDENGCRFIAGEILRRYFNKLPKPEEPKVRI